MRSTSPLTTHVLDTARGCPAANLAVTLFQQVGNGWQHRATGITDRDGRIGDLLEPDDLTSGTYRLTFATADYFTAQNVTGFYPAVSIDFEVRDPKQHYHVPLLLSPYGYSTYRGS